MPGYIHKRRIDDKSHDFPAGFGNHLWLANDLRRGRGEEAEGWGGRLPLLTTREAGRRSSDAAEAPAVNIATRKRERDTDAIYETWSDERKAGKERELERESEKKLRNFVNSTVKEMTIISLKASYPSVFF